MQGDPWDDAEAQASGELLTSSIDLFMVHSHPGQRHERRLGAKLMCFAQAFHTLASGVGTTALATITTFLKTAYGIAS